MIVALISRYVVNKTVNDVTSIIKPKLLGIESWIVSYMHIYFLKLYLLPLHVTSKKVKLSP
jgi:hypothetical protein